MGVLRVLIIEDEILIALLFAEVLMEIGHEVCGSERTEAGAIAAAGICQPDLIIADVRLHEGSGINAVNSILKGGFVPHIFVSGDVIDSRAISSKAIVLQKPFFEAELIKAIARAVEPPTVAMSPVYKAIQATPSISPDQFERLAREKAVTELMYAGDRSPVLAERDNQRP